jgi:hypothetical protein
MGMPWNWQELLEGARTIYRELEYVHSVWRSGVLSVRGDYLQYQMSRGHPVSPQVLLSTHS